MKNGWLERNFLLKLEKRWSILRKIYCLTKYIRDKENNLIPDGCQIEFIITRANCLYECVFKQALTQDNTSETGDLTETEITPSLFDVYAEDVNKDAPYGATDNIMEKTIRKAKRDSAKNNEEELGLVQPDLGL